MTLGSGEPLRNEAVLQFANFDILLTRCLSAIAREDLNDLQVSFDNIGNYLDETGESINQFVLWLVSQYSAVFSELVEQSGKNLIDTLLEREIFDLHAIEDPTIFEATFPSEGFDTDGQT